MSKITDVEVRMYTMGTGDCFAIKFFSGNEEKFKMMIDCGTWSGTGEELSGHIKSLKQYLANSPDVLVVTHEHKDHVHAFHACRDLFENDFHVKELWMAWTEKDGDKDVEEWKRKYGQKKKNIGVATNRLNELINSKAYQDQFRGNRYGHFSLAARKKYIDVLGEFAALHLSASEERPYVNGLEGMDIVKNRISVGERRYLFPGEVISGMPGLDDVRIYVLGPPALYDVVKTESGETGQSYKHNEILKESEAFGLALDNLESDVMDPGLLPFDSHFEADPASSQFELYNADDWRKIDFDWLYSSGMFALRMNSLTNNLSLALAIEIGDERKVLLFPGDAEYGSWSSWHNVKWKAEVDFSGKADVKKQSFAEDLLNRTVFYKVAHHTSHNGTAQKLGLEMMKSKDLVAMATLDYNVIPPGWKSTMPNREIIKELLERTRGRLLFMNEKDLFFDFHEKVSLTNKIQDARKAMSDLEKNDFEKRYKRGDHYIEFRVQV